jgi:hypothetical protein
MYPPRRTCNSRYKGDSVRGTNPLLRIPVVVECLDREGRGGMGEGVRRMSLVLNSPLTVFGIHTQSFI